MTAFDQATAGYAAIAPMRSKGQRWRRRYGVAAFGAAIILAWAIIAVICPLLTPYAPDAVDVSIRLKPPSSAHWLGTDELGRDVLTRLLYGTRVSLTTGFIVVLVGAVFGTLAGGIAAFGRGRIEEAIMRLTDLVLCFPPIILALAIAAALGIGTLNTVIAMLVVWWPKFARLAHSLVLVQRSQEYVEAAVVVGLKPFRILLRHIIPNAIGPSDRAGHARCRQCHYHLRRPVFPGVGGGAPDAGMGFDGRRGARARRAMVGGGFSGLRHSHGCAGLQLPRRRGARLARPEGEAAVSRPGDHTDGGPLPVP